MVNYLKPYIETRYEEAEPDSCPRKSAAMRICDYLKDPSGSKRVDYYKACTELLRKPEARRLALYLPLSTLEAAPREFIDVYRDAWYELLYVYDVRENFHFGDCFEVDARPEEGLQRVSKSAHLTPWLLKNSCISAYELQTIIEGASRRNNYIMLQSFKDVMTYCVEQNLIKQKDRIEKIREILCYLPNRTRQEPLYVSESRKKWLDEKGQPFVALTPCANLEGPFSDNLHIIMPRLEEIASSLEPEKVVLVNGSLIKGYASVNSDIDPYLLDDLLVVGKYYPGSPEGVHIYYDSVWLGGSKAQERMETARRAVIARYKDVDEFARRRCIERLESDLLLYRLLHKGFARFYNWKGNGIPKEMDGDCPFYDDEYRKIATMLFAKYVWL